MFKKIRLVGYEARTIKHALMLVYKILKGLAPHYLQDTFTLVNEIHNVNTRNRNCNIYIDKNIKSKIHRNSYTCYMAKIFNLLPENIKNSKSVNTFKSNLHKHIFNKKLVLP